MADPKTPIPAGVKADLLHFYADPDTPTVVKLNPEKWARVQANLLTLTSMPVIETSRDKTVPSE